MALEQRPRLVEEVAIAVVEGDHDGAPGQRTPELHRFAPLVELDAAEAGLAQIAKLLVERRRGHPVASGGRGARLSDPVVHEDRQPVGGRRCLGGGGRGATAGEEVARDVGQSLGRGAAVRRLVLGAGRATLAPAERPEDLDAPLRSVVIPPRDSPRASGAPEQVRRVDDPLRRSTGGPRSTAGSPAASAASASSGAAALGSAARRGRSFQDRARRAAPVRAPTARSHVPSRTGPEPGARAKSGAALAAGAIETPGSGLGQALAERSGGRDAPPDYALARRRRQSSLPKAGVSAARSSCARSSRLPAGMWMQPTGPPHGEDHVELVFIGLHGRELRARLDHEPPVPSPARVARAVARARIVERLGRPLGAAPELLQKIAQPTRSCRSRSRASSVPAGSLISTRSERSRRQPARASLDADLGVDAPLEEPAQDAPVEPRGRRVGEDRARDEAVAERQFHHPHSLALELHLGEQPLLAALRVDYVGDRGAEVQPIERLAPRVSGRSPVERAIANRSNSTRARRASPGAAAWRSSASRNAWIRRSADRHRVAQSAGGRHAPTGTGLREVLGDPAGLELRVALALHLVKKRTCVLALADHEAGVPSRELELCRGQFLSRGPVRVAWSGSGTRGSRECRARSRAGHPRSPGGRPRRSSSGASGTGPRGPPSRAGSEHPGRASARGPSPRTSEAMHRSRRAPRPWSGGPGGVDRQHVRARQAGEDLRRPAPDVGRGELAVRGAAPPAVCDIDAGVLDERARQPRQGLGLEPVVGVQKEQPLRQGQANSGVSRAALPACS